MPTDTFIKLPHDKKEKILSSAKSEFTRVGLKDASIKNIVENAGIARGSFYQYFESKEDLLQYLLQEHVEAMNRNIEETITRTKGDIFEIFITIYDYMVNKCEGEVNFFKKLFEQIKMAEDDMFAIDLKRHKPKRIEDYYNLIDKSKLKAKKQEHFKLVINILQSVTRRAIVASFNYESKEEAKLNYLKQLDYIKYGILE